MTTELNYEGYVPGNNGKKGLLRMSVKDKNELKKRFFWDTRAQTRNRHKGPVKLELIRHGMQLMDYDNLVSTGKLLIDAIVKAGIILDDSKQIIQERDYHETPALNFKSQRTIIRITDLVTN